MGQFLNQSLYPAEFDLHKKYATSDLLLDLIWTHSNVLADITTDLLDSGHFDASSIPRGKAIKAALLLDIGVYQCSGFEWIPGQPLLEHPYAEHTVLGAHILEAEGYAEEIVRVALVHTGVGLTADDITSHGLQLPVADYMPSNNFEWLLTYASKFHSKTPAFKSPEEIETSLAKYSQEKVDTFKQLQAAFGIPCLEKIQAKYEEWHQGFKFKVSELMSGSIGNSIIATPSVSLNSAGIATPIGEAPQNNVAMGTIEPVSEVGSQQVTVEIAEPTIEIQTPEEAANTSVDQTGAMSAQYTPVASNPPMTLPS